MSIYQVVDIYQDGDIYLKLKSENGVEIKRVEFSDCLYFKISGFFNDDYEKNGYSCINSKIFSNGWIQNKTLFGKLEFNPRDRESKISLLNEKHENIKFYNTSFDVIHRFKMCNDNLNVGDLITFDHTISKVKDQSSKGERIKQWECYTFDIEIEKPTQRREPVANWKYDSERYNMDYEECTYEKTQAIISIKLSKFSLDDSQIKEEYEFNQPNEIDTMKVFIKYMQDLKIDLLLCYDYDTGLDYVYKRWMYHNLDENTFKTKVYKTKNTKQISVGYLKYNSPNQYVYLSIFLLYYNIEDHKKIGYKYTNLSKHYYDKILEVNEFNVQLFKDKHYLSWIIESTDIFKTDYRDILGMPSVKFYNVLITETKEDYLIEHKYCTKTKTKSLGGKTMESEQFFVFDDVVSVDFESAYPRIMIEYNLCPTTFCYKKNEDTNTFKCENGIRERGSDDSFTYFIKREKFVGVVPKLLIKNIQLRLDIKKLMRDFKEGSKEYVILDQRQKNLKLFSNIIYGLYGSYSIFRNLQIANTITYIGRKLLTDLKILFEESNIKVVGGDTDSLMPRGDVEKIKELCAIYSMNYDHITVKLESIFEKIFFVNKKNYIALKNGKIVIKGTGAVRKDYCQFTKRVCTLIAQEILNKSSKDSITTKIVDIFETLTDEQLEHDNYTFGSFSFLNKENDCVMKREVIPQMITFLKFVNIEYKDIAFLIKEKNDPQMEVAK